MKPLLLLSAIGIGLAAAWWWLVLRGGLWPECGDWRLFVDGEAVGV